MIFLENVFGFIHSFIQRILTESLRYARYCSQWSEYSSKQNQERKRDSKQRAYDIMSGGERDSEN